MVIQSEQLFWIQAVAYALLLAAGYVSFVYLLRAIPRRRRRWPALVMQRWARGYEVPPRILKLFGIAAGSRPVEEKGRLLAEGGIRIDPLRYELLRRFLLLAGGGSVAVGYAAAAKSWTLPWIEPVHVMAAGAVIGVFAGFDRTLLVSLGKYRSNKIMREIYVLSNQLLYYTGSKMSLHAKLNRCLPFCRAIRSDLQLLLNEWYEDADQAIKRFKKRLGTEEAHSFAETINSLRLNEHGSYYSLLHERIQDYKEKLELAKESRKETTSYLLFVLAGIPILNTFRIFVYPWVQEGQKLFDALN
ncbi:hypothetical protein PV433_03615 [Paenibacillus sp. GYB004]|uniref:hypothetical protein n=1 Tax=Paenibacillus sp. GYB004 TaxID=2994393 RepID=UPI002F96BD7C